MHHGLCPSLVSSPLWARSRLSRGFQRGNKLSEQARPQREDIPVMSSTYYIHTLSLVPLFNVLIIGRLKNTILVFNKNSWCWQATTEIGLKLTTNNQLVWKKVVELVTTKPCSYPGRGDGPAWVRGSLGVAGLGPGDGTKIWRSTPFHWTVEFQPLHKGAGSPYGACHPD